MAKADARNLQFGPKHDVAQFVFTPKTQLAQVDLTQAMVGKKTMTQFVEDLVKRESLEKNTNTITWLKKQFPVITKPSDAPVFSTKEAAEKGDFCIE
jgi:hypothetical protein